MKSLDDMTDSERVAHVDSQLRAHVTWAEIAKDGGWETARLYAAVRRLGYRSRRGLERARLRKEATP